MIILGFVGFWLLSCVVFKARFLVGIFFANLHNELEVNYVLPCDYSAACPVMNTQEIGNNASLMFGISAQE